MRQKNDLRRTAAGFGLVFFLGLAAIGCASTPNGNGGDDAEYSLWVTLENNLFENKDILRIRFYGKNLTPTGGQVKVGDDLFNDFGSAVQVTANYGSSKWTTGVWIQIMAEDSTGTVVYRDSVKIPQDFAITFIDPDGIPWFPSQLNPRIEWQTSLNAVNYMISVKPPAGSDALGYAEYHESQSSLTETFTPEVFNNQYDQVRVGDYRVQVIAYNPNFVPRNDANFMPPKFNNIPQPIITPLVTGAISALTVSDAKTITVDSSNR